MADNTYFEDVPAAQLLFKNKKFGKIEKEEPLNAKKLFEVYKVLIEMLTGKENISDTDMEILASRLGSVQIQHVHTTGVADGERKTFMRYVMLRMEEEFTSLREEMKEVKGSNDALKVEMKEVKNSLQKINTTLNQAIQSFNKNFERIDQKFDESKHLNRIVHAKAFNLQYRQWNRKRDGRYVALPLKVVEGRGEGFLGRSVEYQQQQEDVPIGRRPLRFPSRAYVGVVPPVIFGDLSSEVIDKMALVYNNKFDIKPEDDVRVQRLKFEHWVREGPVMDEHESKFFEEYHI